MVLKNTILTSILLLSVFSCRKDQVIIIDKPIQTENNSIVLVDESFDKDLGINKTTVYYKPNSTDTLSVSTVKIEDGLLRLYAKYYDQTYIDDNAAPYAIATLNYDSIIKKVQKLDLKKVEFIIKQSSGSRIALQPAVGMPSSSVSSKFTGKFLNIKFDSYWEGLSGRTVYDIDLNQPSITQTDDGKLVNYWVNGNSLSSIDTTSIDLHFYNHIEPSTSIAFGNSNEIEIEYIQIIGYY